MGWWPGFCVITYVRMLVAAQTLLLVVAGVRLHLTLRCGAEVDQTCLYSWNRSAFLAGLRIPSFRLCALKSVITLAWRLVTRLVACPTTGTQTLHASKSRACSNGTTRSCPRSCSSPDTSSLVSAAKTRSRLQRGINTHHRQPGHTLTGPFYFGQLHNTRLHKSAMHLLALAGCGVASCNITVLGGWWLPCGRAALQQGSCPRPTPHLNVSMATASTGSGSSESYPMTLSHSSRVSAGASCDANADISQGKTMSSRLLVMLPRCWYTSASTSCIVQQHTAY